MDIRFDVRCELTLRTEIGDVVVDYHVNLLDIYPTRDDIGGDEDFGLAVSEAVEDIVTFSRQFVAVQRSDAVSFVREPLRDCIGSGFALVSLG